MCQGYVCHQGTNTATTTTTSIPPPRQQNLGLVFSGVFPEEVYVLYTPQRYQWSFLLKQTHLVFGTSQHYLCSIFSVVQWIKTSRGGWIAVLVWWIVYISHRAIEGSWRRMWLSDKFLFCCFGRDVCVCTIMLWYTYLCNNWILKALLWASTVLIA